MEKIHIKFDLSAIANCAVRIFFSWINCFWLAYAYLFGKNMGLLIIVAFCVAVIHELGHALILSSYGYKSEIGFDRTERCAYTALAKESSSKFDKQVSRSQKCVIDIAGPVAGWLFLLLFWRYSGNFVIPVLLITREIWQNYRKPGTDFRKLYLRFQEA